MKFIKKVKKYILRKCKFFVRRMTIKDININTLDDVYRAIEETKNSKAYRLQIPIEKVCMHGGFRYNGGWHPFVAFLEKGVKELECFYKHFTPQNLVQMYFLTEMDKVYDLPPWELPWVSRHVMSKPADEGGMSLEQHGASYFGPVSSKKLAFECKRLTTILKSIREKGYTPPPHTDSEINGFFMEHNNDFVFFIRGGKHRVAVLSFLNYKKIPAVLRKGWAPIFHSRDSNKWELVQSGEISEELALNIFISYFHYNGEFQFSKINIHSQGKDHE